MLDSLIPLLNGATRKPPHAISPGAKRYSDGEIIKRLCDHDNLSREEELRLLQRLHDDPNQLEARDALVRHYWKFTRLLAQEAKKQFSHARRRPMLELMNLAGLKLLDVIKAFDFNRKNREGKTVRLMTPLKSAFYNLLSDEGARDSILSRVSSTRKVWKYYERACNVFLQAKKEHPSDEDLAKELKRHLKEDEETDEKELARMIRVLKGRYAKTQALEHMEDKNFEEVDNRTRHETESSTRLLDKERSHSLNRLARLIRDPSSHLSPESRYIVAASYGLGGTYNIQAVDPTSKEKKLQKIKLEYQKTYDLREIASLLGISHEKVRGDLTKAIIDLRKTAKTDSLSDRELVAFDSIVAFREYLRAIYNQSPNPLCSFPEYTDKVLKICSDKKLYSDLALSQSQLNFVKIAIDQNSSEDNLNYARKTINLNNYAYVLNKLQTIMMRDKNHFHTDRLDKKPLKQPKEVIKKTIKLKVLKNALLQYLRSGQRAAAAAI